MSVGTYVCSRNKNIEKLKYADIRYEKGTITTFELFFEGHRVDSMIYDL